MHVCARMSVYVRVHVCVHTQVGLCSFITISSPNPFVARPSEMPAQPVACPIPPCLVALGPQTWTSSRGPIAGPSKPASRSLWLQNWSARSPGPHSGLIRRTQCSRLETGRKGRGFSSGLVLKRAERRLLPFPRFGFILWSYVPQRMRARENLYS